MEKEYVDPKEMIALEQELADLKEQYGIQDKKKWWVFIGDWIVQRTNGKRPVERKKYIRWAVIGGWLWGAHRFYAKQQILGMMYLLFCWTGISLAMTLIDLIIVLPMEPDDNGIIYL